jgi:phosphoglycolate phosphatase-like HAD superfamily hydrolase
VLWDIDGTLINAAGFGRRLAERAYRQVCGTPLAASVQISGRTDRAIHLDELAAHGQDVAHLASVCRAIGVLAEANRDDLLAGGGRALPGALAAIAALAGQPDLVQSVLSGNLRAVGLVKLGALGFLDRLDIECAAFGDDHVVRADLVGVARAQFRARHASEPDVVLVGDTPLDIAAARESGAAVVCVATGGYSAGELISAGGPVVLPDLTDAAQVVAAVLAARPLSNRAVT